jgi:tRNA(Arg) A34 adenosine deaminase TadA
MAIGLEHRFRVTLIFVLLAVCTAARAAAPSAVTPVVAERRELFMLAALAQTHAGLADLAGYDISAVIAWNVDDASKTPEFVIERNRNYEKQGEIHHAEINTLRAAYDRTRDFNVAPRTPASARPALYKDDLNATTLFTTLEPCPMCATTITMAKVPRAIYCMEDPGLRDPATHATTVVIPTQFYGRVLQQERSGIASCEAQNTAMWNAHAEARAQKGRFSITTYLTSNGPAVFGPGWKALSCWKLQHAENAGLLAALQAATGATTCAK